MQKYQESLIQLKQLLLKYSWIVSFTFVATIIALGSSQLSLNSEEWTALIAGAFGFTYFCQSHRIANEDLFLSAFRSFNERYDKLNDELSRLSQQDNSTSNCSEKIIIDYFNLCAEEYRLYREGFIPIDVWKSWKAGMGYIFENKYVQLLWLIEQIKYKDSYYEFNPENLLNKKFIMVKNESIKNKMCEAA